MLLRAGIVLLGLGLLCSPAASAMDKKKESAAKDPTLPTEVEIRLADGSTIRVELLQESIQVMTKYGPLTIPVSELRRIEFGIHVSETMRAQINQALKQLSSDDFKQREDASQALVTIGAAAYPALHAAQKTSDPDRAKRVQETLKQLRARVPASMLKLRIADQVQTAEFPVVGRISSTSLKVRSTYFGERELQVSDFLSLRAVGGMSESEVIVDAGRYAIANQWMDTNIEVAGETPIDISADGKIDLQQGGQILAGPVGWQQGGRQIRVGQVTHFPGTLMGRIGENGREFVIGERYSGKTLEPGKLFLHIVPSPWGMSVGEYKVKVVVNGPR
jgi:hypothetical protein